MMNLCFLAIVTPNQPGAAAGLAPVLGGGWAGFRTLMFFRRRRATATVFAAGNPIDTPKGSFPLIVADADKAINHFLRCKGVKLDGDADLFSSSRQVSGLVSKMMNFVSKMMNFLLKMMNFKGGCGGGC